MNIKNEGQFILKKYFTNGFTIWAFLMLVTYYTRSELLISEFRSSLWLDQLMWVFFIPLFTQVILDVATRLKVIKKFHWFSKTMLLYVIAGSGFGWVLILDFAFFSGGIMLVIGEYQNGIAIADIEKYTFMTNLVTLSGLFIMPFFSISVNRINSYLIENQVIVERKFSTLTIQNKISIFCIAFSLAFCSFVIYHDILKL